MTMLTTACLETAPVLGMLLIFRLHQLSLDLHTTGMFTGCNSMSGTIDIAATSFASGAMNQMFLSNNSPNYSIRVNFDTWDLDPDPWLTPQSVHANWFNTTGYASNIFYCPADLPEERGYDKIPQNWTIVHE